MAMSAAAVAALMLMMPAPAESILYNGGPLMSPGFAMAHPDSARTESTFNIEDWRKLNLKCSMSRVVHVSYDSEAWEASVRHLEHPSFNTIGVDPSELETKRTPNPKARDDPDEINWDEQYGRHLAWELYSELAPSGCFECSYNGKQY